MNAPTPETFPLPGGTSRRQLLAATLGTAAAALPVMTAQAAPAAAATAPAPGSTAAPRRRRFEGKVVLVTGATSGIGRAAAIQFAAEGAKVAFCGRREALGAEVEKLIRAQGGEASYVRADVRQEKDVAAFVDAAVRKYGRLDVAFNNAGISIEKPVHEFSTEEWDDVQATNVRGVFLAMKHELPHMIKTGKGSIVNTSSTQALLTGEKKAAYAASKRAIVGLTQAAAYDCAEQGIRINALLPGTTNTDFVRRLAGMMSMPDLVWGVGASQWAKSHVPGLKRMATPEEVAAFALLLASDDHPYLLAAALPIDGGQSAHAP